MVTSSTTSNKEIGQSPFSPMGYGGTASASLLLLLADNPCSRSLLLSRERTELLQSVGNFNDLFFVYVFQQRSRSHCITSMVKVART